MAKTWWLFVVVGVVILILHSLQPHSYTFKLRIEVEYGTAKRVDAP
jgi:hypothetical protein